MKNLSEGDKEKFLYELRLRFLKDMNDADFYMKGADNLKARGPEHFYRAMLEPEEGETEKERLRSEKLYHKFVALAHAGKHNKNYDGEDYMYDLEKLLGRTDNYSRSAFYEAKLMRDLIVNKNS